LTLSLETGKKTNFGKQPLERTARTRRDETSYFGPFYKESRCEEQSSRGRTAAIAPAEIRDQACEAGAPKN